MKKKEMLEIIVRCLHEYYSPIVTIREIIDLTMVRIMSQMDHSKIYPILGTVIDIMSEEVPYEQLRDDICLGLTVRLFDHDKSDVYLIIVGEPEKDEWYKRSLVVLKESMDKFESDEFKYPERDY